MQLTFWFGLAKFAGFEVSRKAATAWRSLPRQRMFRQLENRHRKANISHCPSDVNWRVMWQVLFWRITSPHTLVIPLSQLIVVRSMRALAAVSPSKIFFESWVFALRHDVRLHTRSRNPRERRIKTFPWPKTTAPTLGFHLFVSQKSNRKATITLLCDSSRRVESN